MIRKPLESLGSRLFTNLCNHLPTTQVNIWAEQNRVKLSRRMLSWRNVVPARSHDTAVEPIIEWWKKERLCDKVMCPWTKRWRKIAEGKDTTTDLCDELCNEFFECVLASKPRWRIQSDNVEAMERQNAILYPLYLASELSGVEKQDKNEVTLQLYQAIRYTFVWPLPSSVFC